MYKHFLVPTDGSKVSLKAVKAASKLAKSLKARITALYVIGPFLPPSSGESALLLRQTGAQKMYEKGMAELAAKALAKVEATAGAAKVRCDMRSVTDFHPWEAIIKAARTQKCDLIVMASHGRRGLAGLLIGSETHKVLMHSKDSGPGLPLARSRRATRSCASSGSTSITKPRDSHRPSIAAFDTSTADRG